MNNNKNTNSSSLLRKQPLTHRPLYEPIPKPQSALISPRAKIIRYTKNVTQIPIKSQQQRGANNLAKKPTCLTTVQGTKRGDSSNISTEGALRQLITLQSTTFDATVSPLNLKQQSSTFQKLHFKLQPFQQTDPSHTQRQQPLHEMLLQDQQRKRQRDPRVIKQQKIKRLETNLDLIRTSLETIPAQTIQTASRIGSNIRRVSSSKHHHNQKSLPKPIQQQSTVQLVEHASCPISIEEKDSHEFDHARQYFQDKVLLHRQKRRASNHPSNLVGKKTILHRGLLSYRASTIKLNNSGSTSRLNQSMLVQFDQKKLTRQLDELEHKGKCLVERRNRLWKELKHLKEVNHVYDAIDGEIYGTNAMNLSQMSIGNESQMSLRSQQRQRQFQNMSTTMTPRIGKLNKVSPRNINKRSTSNVVGFKASTIRSAQASPSVKSMRNNNNPLLQSGYIDNSALNQSMNQSMKSPRHERILRSLSKQSLSELRMTLSELEQKTKQERLQQSGLKQMLQRERSNSVDKQLRIAILKPEVRRMTQISLKVEAVKRLDQVRKLVALNTKKIWQRRIETKASQRCGLLEQKQGQLGEEEDKSNELMSEYYMKLKQLLEIKESIKAVQETTHQMKEEQQREEQILSDREHQFYLVDRLGLLIVLQKYCTHQKKRGFQENRLEMDILKKYFANREQFSYQQQQLQHDDLSPQKQVNLKTQLEAMDLRLDKLKNYQVYYSKNWSIISNYHFDFGMLESKSHEVESSVKSLETQHQELIKIVKHKKSALEHLIQIRDQMKRDRFYLEQFQNKELSEDINILQDNLQNQVQQLKFLLQIKQRSKILFESTSSMLMNVLLSSCNHIKQMVVKMKMTYPERLSDMLHKYAHMLQDNHYQNVEESTTSPKGGSGSTSHKRATQHSFNIRSYQQQLKLDNTESDQSFALNTTDKKSSPKRHSPKKAVTTTVLLANELERQKITFCQKALFNDLRYIFTLLINENKSLHNEDFFGIDAGKQLLINVNLLFPPEPVQSFTSGSSRRQQTLLQQAEVGSQSSKNKNNLAIIESQTIQWVNPSHQQIPLVKNISSPQQSTKTQNVAVDQEEKNEEQYMRSGKQDIRMRKVFFSKLQKAAQEQRKLVLQMRKKNTQIIENFEKTEQQFIGQYLMDSNNAINNGDQVTSQNLLLSLSNGRKRMSSRNGLMHQRSTEKLAPLFMGSHLQSTNNQRKSSASTMALTHRDPQLDYTRLGGSGTLNKQPTLTSSRGDIHHNQQKAYHSPSKSGAHFFPKSNNFMMGGDLQKQGSQTRLDTRQEISHAQKSRRVTTARAEGRKMH